MLLQARPAIRHPGNRAVREDLNVAQKSRGFFGPRRSARPREWSLVEYWCPRGTRRETAKLFAEHSLQVEWSQEKPESASGIGGVTQPIGVVYVPVGLAGCNGIIRFTVLEAGCPTSTAGGDNEDTPS